MEASPKIDKADLSTSIELKRDEEDGHQETILLIDDSDDLTRTFYLFSYGDKFVEVRNLDFSTDEIVKDCLYTYSPIADLRLAKNNSGDRKPLFALVTQDSSTSLMRYTISQSWH